LGQSAFTFHAAPAPVEVAADESEQGGSVEAPGEVVQDAGEEGFGSAAQTQ
jgi:hypothetical protein